MARILVVDDEKVMVKGIRFNLENEGYEVDVGYNGREAVDKARATDYDLIILDLMMPELDGLEACMEIRAFSTVPIIMLTARSEDNDKLLGFEYGARQLDKRPLSPGTSREASGVPCLNPRRGLTLLSPVCRDPAIGV